jgi:hypothetical protein
VGRNGRGKHKLCKGEEEKNVADRKEENQGKCDFSSDFISLLQTVFSKKFHISFFFETSNVINHSGKCSF